MRMAMLILAALLASPMLNGTPQDTAIVVTFGIWPVCESAAAPSVPACNGFQPGHETYLLMIQTSAPAVTGYRYAVTATPVSSGQPVTISGAAERNDNQYGWTVVPIDFGGVVIAQSEDITIGDMVTVHERSYSHKH